MTAGVGVIIAILAVANWPAAGSGTNTVQLDNGSCVRNLQIGSDPNASSSATPSFVLAGDGGLSSYEMFIDGKSIGTFQLERVRARVRHNDVDRKRVETEHCERRDSVRVHGRHSSAFDSVEAGDG
jgi:hypothetical protein